MNSRKLAGVSAASVGAATAVAALLLGTLPGSAGEDTTASAFGIAAEGLLPISPTPRVEAPPDERKALLEVPGDDHKGQGISIALLKVEAEHFRSKATAVKVNILGLRLRVLEASCDNGHGESSIIGTDGDSEGTSNPYAGQELDLSPVVSVEFNRQRRDHDRLTVDAAVVRLLPGDRRTAALSQKDLDLFKSLASSKMAVPTMDQLQAAHAKSATPAGPVTVTDLVGALKTSNPSLLGNRGDGDALETIVISSASCEKRQENNQQKEEAPPPQPVETHLPVTH
ncbi:MAG: hypothetical protein DLM60_14015 [Pseudonocardiales bacterium]|nr:MAG: hypothetical protein DLM60_14015 [Pseudonocardiales bacterium]